MQESVSLVRNSPFKKIFFVFKSANQLLQNPNGCDFNEDEKSLCLCFFKTHLYHRTSQSTGLIMISFFSKLMYLSLNKEFMYFVLNNVSDLVSYIEQITSRQIATVNKIFRQMTTNKHKFDSSPLFPGIW